MSSTKLQRREPELADMLTSSKPKAPHVQGILVSIVEFGVVL